uniref:Uncharacterized protein n=1 Tax=Timema bartmani TaxID=61472 RepID=A0A7R9EQ20_9NEOP|nr:unnamed protein product [Timema bartmani]
MVEPSKVLTHCEFMLPRNTNAPGKLPQFIGLAPPPNRRLTLKPRFQEKADNLLWAPHQQRALVTLLRTDAPPLLAPSRPKQGNTVINLLFPGSHSGFMAGGQVEGLVSNYVTVHSLTVSIDLQTNKHDAGLMIPSLVKEYKIPSPSEGDPILAHDHTAVQSFKALKRYSRALLLSHHRTWEGGGGDAGCGVLFVYQQ